MLKYFVRINNNDTTAENFQIFENINPVSPLIPIGYNTNILTKAQIFSGVLVYVNEDTTILIIKAADADCFFNIPINPNIQPPTDNCEFIVVSELIGSCEVITDLNYTITP